MVLCCGANCILILQVITKTAIETFFRIYKKCIYFKPDLFLTACFSICVFYVWSRPKNNYFTIIKVCNEAGTHADCAG